MSRKKKTAAKPEIGDAQAAGKQAKEQREEAGGKPVEQAAAQTEALQQAEARIAELEDRLLRAHAEMENVRKRAARQVEDASKFALEKFASALLNVTDNLERALEAEITDADALREGVQMTLNSLHEVKRKFGIKRMDAVGKPFDPNLHEAMLQAPSAEKAGTVIEQHAAGYTLHGRLLRPAHVIVSSGPAKESGE